MLVKQPDRSPKPQGAAGTGSSSFKSAPPKKPEGGSLQNSSKEEISEETLRRATGRSQGGLFEV